MGEHPLPLQGIKVVAFSNLLAGPYCSMMLGDMGAEVIKVERLRGDDSRFLGPPFVMGESTPFLSVNRNKKGIALDVWKEKGREIFLKLTEGADVLVHNYRPEIVKRLGFDYEQISRINPRIVYTSISSFGEEGEFRDRPGVDIVIQGMSGVMSITGEPDGRPMKVGTPIADVAAGMFAAYGTISALFARERFGIGQKVEVSLLNGMIALQAPRTGIFFATGENPPRLGNNAPYTMPSGSYKTKDSYINVSVPNRKFWGKFCSILGIEHLRDDPRFATNAKRVENRDQLMAIIEEIFQQRTTAEWLEVFEREDYTSGPILSYREILSHPLVARCEMVVELEHPVGGPIKVTGIPAKLSKTPGRVALPPPALGQHTEEVLTSLGYSCEEISVLKMEKVVFQHHEARGLKSEGMRAEVDDGQGEGGEILGGLPDR
ncbi:MAG: CaiB/BaiF CoA transferase family protein [Thermodesulfobacteriota bacterium]